MPRWIVELAEDLIEDLEQRRSDQSIAEAVAIKESFEAGGPEALSARPSDLEGVPAWDALSSPVSFLLPEPFSSGAKSMRIEVCPDRKIIVVWID